MAGTHSTSSAGGTPTPAAATAPISSAIKSHPALRAARSVIEVVDVLADLGILFNLVLRSQDGKKTMNPDAVRALAPGIFKDKGDRFFYLRVLEQLADQGVRSRIDEFMRDSNLGEHQQADFILSVCAHADGKTPEERVLNLRLTHQFLTELAALGTFGEMIERCDERNFMLGREDEYVVVKLQKFGGIAIRSLKKLEVVIIAEFYPAVEADNAALQRTIQSKWARLTTNTVSPPATGRFSWVRNLFRLPARYRSPF